MEATSCDTMLSLNTSVMAEYSQAKTQQLKPNATSMSPFFQINKAVSEHLFPNLLFFSTSTQNSRFIL